MSSRLSRRTLVKGAAGSALLAGVGMPAIVKAQADAIRIGHLTPRTGFLGPLGEYAVMAVDLAVEEINAAGGVMGRKVELVKEDSVNPQTASDQGRAHDRARQGRLHHRRDFVGLVPDHRAGRAPRTKTLFINTGGNSDALRGNDCKRYMFHVEAQNSMYVKTVGRSLLRDEPGQGQEVVLADGRLRLRP